MAHIEIHHGKGDGAYQLLVNGIDLSHETFRGLELVEVGDDPEYAEVGLRITLAVSTLSIDHEPDVQLTDNLPAAAAKVRTFLEEVTQ